MHRILLLTLLAASGCTAVKAGYAIQDAQRSLRTAVDAHADQRAIYEMTLAEQYLIKAREEDGYSDFGAADKLARKAKEAAANAVKIAEEGGVPLEDVANLPENRRELRVEEQTDSPFDTEDDAP